MKNDRASGRGSGPLGLALLVQSLLLLTRLDLLPPWGDELFTLFLARLPWRDLLERVGRDIHPPLFFLAEWAWMKLPVPWSDITQGRILAAFGILAATILLDRLWLRELPENTRRVALVLWSLSPCLLLYGRMARSYSWQVALMLAGVWCAMQLLQRPGLNAAVRFALAAALLMYTHYIPGLALLAGLIILCILRYRAAWRPGAGSLALTVLLFLPWAAWLQSALRRWGTANRFSFSGSPLRDEVIKLGYTVVSLLGGETYPLAGLILLLILLLPLTWLAFRGLRTAPPWMPLMAIITLISYVGVARWVSYAFVPARLLFLLPFLLLLIVPAAQRKLGRVLIALWGVLAILGDVGYFARDGFLNKAYLLPYLEIVQQIENAPDPGHKLVVLDTFNSDFATLAGLLPPGLAVIQINGPAAADLVVQLAERPSTGTVWAVRNCFDRSPGRINTVLERRLAQTRVLTRREYVPYAEREQQLARWSGIVEPPVCFYELEEFRRPLSPMRP